MSSVWVKLSLVLIVFRSFGGFGDSGEEFVRSYSEDLLLLLSACVSRFPRMSALGTL